ncbi:unnamed protein product, partial [Oppiella nova]
NEDINQVKSSRNFRGKVVLVTGSSSGIGEGIVKLFSILGAKVVVTGRKAAEVTRVAKEAQELSPKKEKPLEVVADVTKSDDLNRLMSETIKTFGRLDVLVNNAGIFKMAGIKDKRNFMKVFDQTIQVNLRPYLELIQLAIPHLEKTNGTIISTSSRLSENPVRMGMAYGISKAGVDMMTKTLALELGPKIRVNAVNPGPTESNLNSNTGFDPNIMNALMGQLMENTPLRRLGEPLDVAKAVVFLASSDARFITGANINIDGGLQAFAV